MPAAKSDRWGRKGEGDEVGIDGKRRERGMGNGERMTTNGGVRSSSSAPAALRLFCPSLPLRSVFVFADAATNPCETRIDL